MSFTLTHPIQCSIQELIFFTTLWDGNSAMTQYRSTAFLGAVSLLLVLSGCREIPTSVKIGTGSSFSLGGSGRLATFTVYAPQSTQKIAFPDRDLASVVWQVTASKGYFKGSHVKGLQLTYGKVPSATNSLCTVSRELLRLPSAQFMLCLRKQPMPQSPAAISTWANLAPYKRRFQTSASCSYRVEKAA